MAIIENFNNTSHSVGNVEICRLYQLMVVDGQMGLVKCRALLHMGVWLKIFFFDESKGKIVMLL